MPGAGKNKNEDHSVAVLNLISTGKGGLLGLAGNSILFCLSCHFFRPFPTHTQKLCKDLVSYTVSELWGGPPGSWSHVKDLCPAVMVPSMCGSVGVVVQHLWWTWTPSSRPLGAGSWTGCKACSPQAGPEVSFPHFTLLPSLVRLS